MHFNGSGYLEEPPPEDHTSILVRMAGTLGQVYERTLSIERRLAHGDKRMDAQDRMLERQTELLVDTRRRVQTVEDRRLSTRLKSALSVASAVAPLKEWIIGAVIVLLALNGILSPQDLKAAILSALMAGN